jgi:hypothetical protein
MEEEQDDVDPDFLKGFNEGYIIAHYNPELAGKLAEINSGLSRITGFKAGLEQFQAERIQIQQQEESEPDSHRSQTQPVPEQTDVFDQLYRQQEELYQKLSSSPDLEQGSQEDNLFLQLKKKQEQDHKGHDLEP